LDSGQSLGFEHNCSKVVITSEFGGTIFWLSFWHGSASIDESIDIGDIIYYTKVLLLWWF
jgi:hypothetical protein